MKRITYFMHLFLKGAKPKRISASEYKRLKAMLADSSGLPLFYVFTSIDRPPLALSGPTQPQKEKAREKGIKMEEVYRVQLSQHRIDLKMKNGDTINIHKDSTGH